MVGDQPNISLSGLIVPYGTVIPLHRGSCDLSQRGGLPVKWPSYVPEASFNCLHGEYSATVWILKPTFPTPT